MRQAGSNRLRSGRVSLSDQAYFITACTAGRAPHFQSPAIADQMIEHMQDPENWMDARPVAWVVMPDHVHCIAFLGATPLSTVMARFKGRSSRFLQRSTGTRGRFWQKGFHDHAIRCDRDLQVLIGYMLENPIRAGLASEIDQWPWKGGPSLEAWLSFHTSIVSG